MFCRALYSCSVQTVNTDLFPQPYVLWSATEFVVLFRQIVSINTTKSKVTLFGFVADSTRLLFATWWIFITILTSFYTANLTAFLTLSRFTLPIEGPKELVKTKSGWIAHKGSALEYLVQASVKKRAIGDEDTGKPGARCLHRRRYHDRNYVGRHLVCGGRLVVWLIPLKPETICHSFGRYHVLVCGRIHLDQLRQKGEKHRSFLCASIGV